MTKDQETQVLEILRQITQGMGRYSRDPLTHASNTIDDMKQLASEAIAIMEGELKK